MVTRANLPHWGKSRTATFVTFRLIDSLPQEKLLALEAQRADWLATHPEPWDDAMTRDYYETFDGRIQDWLDRGFGSCALADGRCREIVEAALWHFAGERYALYAYVMMPNHVHVLFMPTRDGSTMSEIVASWKKFTGRQINAMLGREGPLWQKESYDTLVRSERHFQTIVRYIRKNCPEKAWSI